MGQGMGEGGGVTSPWQEIDAKSKASSPRQTSFHYVFPHFGIQWNYAGFRFRAANHQPGPPT